MSLIQERRKLMGLSQEQLANKIDVSRPQISYFESYLAEPNIPQLLKLSKVLKVSASKLIKDYGNYYATHYTDKNKKHIK